MAGYRAARTRGRPRRRRAPVPGRRRVVAGDRRNECRRAYGRGRRRRRAGEHRRGDRRGVRAGGRGVRRAGGDGPGRPRRAAARDGRRPGGRPRPGRAGRGPRERARRATPERRAHPHPLPAGAVRGRAGGGLLRRGRDRPRRGHRDGPAAGRAPDAGAARPGGGVRGEQLPAGVLGAGRRHGVGARRGLPGRGEGAPVAPGHLPAVLRAAGRRRTRGARAGGRGRPRARRSCRHGPGRASGDPRGRLHRVAARRPRSVRGGGRAPGPDPVLRRDGQPEPAGGHARGGR